MELELFVQNDNLFKCLKHSVLGVFKMINN